MRFTPPLLWIKKLPPKPNPMIGFRTDLTVGEILKRSRLKKKLSLQDIEVAIRVSAQHLAAIENNNLEMLPGRIYALGFIKAYAEHVGLDSGKLLELLKRQAGEKVVPKAVSAKPATVLDDFTLPSAKILLIVFVLFIGTFVAKSHFIGDNYLMDEQIPQVPKDLVAQTTLLPKPEEKNEPKVEEQKSDNIAVSSVEELLPPPPKGQIVLKAMENVWLEIRDVNKKTLFSRVLSMGEEYWIPLDQKDLTMTLGNAGGLQILIDGEALPFLGKTGQVIRKVDLNAEILKQNLKIPPKPAM